MNYKNLTNMKKTFSQTNKYNERRTKLREMNTLQMANTTTQTMATG